MTNILASQDNEINNIQKQWNGYYNSRLAAYIDILQCNGLSYRAIADELAKRGIQVTHQVIFRQHQSWMKERKAVNQ